MLIANHPGDIECPTSRSVTSRPRRTGRSRRAHAVTARSTEAEIREILRLAAQPPGTLRFGDELATLGAAFGGVELKEKRSGKPMRAAKLA